MTGKFNRALRSVEFLMIAASLAAGPGTMAVNAEVVPPRTQPTLREDLMTVTGTADVQAAPDTANVSFGVVSQASTAAKASSDEARKMSAVIDAVRGAGVKDEDIHTDQLSLEPQHAISGGIQNPKIEMFQATNMVQVTLHDLTAHPDAVGPVVDAALGAGANQLNGISFSVANDVSYRTQALAKAATAAAAKAQVLATALNLNLAGVAAVAEGISTGPQPMFNRVMMAGASPAPSTPVLPGQITISASVTLQYHITGG